jgi:hypothetical protein
MPPVDNQAALRQAQLEAMRREQERIRQEQERQRQIAAQKAAAELGRRQAEQAKQAQAAQLAHDPDARAAAVQAQRDRQTLEAQVERITPKEAQAEAEHLQSDLKQAKSAEDVQAIADRADALRGRVEASHDATFSDALRQDVTQLQDKATGARLGLERLSQVEQQLKSGTPEDRTAAMARLLARPNELKGALKDLKGLPDVDKRVDALDKLASPERLADALAKNPDLSRYPSDTTADLARLRDVDNGPLQHELNRVASGLLEGGGGVSADHPGQQPLSFQAIKADPSLAKLVGPLAKSPSKEVQAKFAQAVQTWQTQALRQSMDEHAQAPGPDGHPSGEENAKAAFDQFQKDMKDLGDRTGQPQLVQQQLAGAVRDAGEQLLDGGLSLEQVKANPAYGQLIGPMAADPKYQGQIQQLMTGWAEKSLENSLHAGDKGQGPDVPTTGEDGKPLPGGAVNGAKSLQAFQQEMAGLYQQTGLDPSLAMQDATKNVAKRLADGDLPIDKVKNNGAYGQLLGTLQDDPAYQGKVNDTIKGWVGQAIDKNCEGKEGEDGVKHAQEGAIKDIQTVAQITGLGGAEAFKEDKLKQAFEDKGDKFKEVSDRGKSWFEKGVDWVGKGLGKLVELSIDISPVGLAMNGLKHLGVADGLTKEFDGFKHGMGDALSGTVSGLGTMIAHPIKTVENLGMMVTHPSMIVEAGKAMWKEGVKGGIGHAIGYFGGNIALMVGTGGAGAAIKGFATGAKAAELVSTAANASKIGQFAIKGAEFAGKGLNLAKQGLQIAGETKLGQFATLAGGKVAGVAGKAMEAPGVKQVVGAQQRFKTAMGEMGERAGARVAGRGVADAPASTGAVSGATKAAAVTHGADGPVGGPAPVNPNHAGVHQVPPHTPTLVDTPAQAGTPIARIPNADAHRAAIDGRIAQARQAGQAVRPTTPQGIDLPNLRDEQVRVPSNSNPEGWKVAGRDVNGDVVVYKDGHGSKAVSPGTLATENPGILRNMALPDGSVVSHAGGDMARVMRMDGNRIVMHDVPVAKLLDEHPDLVARHVQASVDALPAKEIRNGQPVNVDPMQPLRENPNIARLPDLLGHDGRLAVNRAHTQDMAATHYNRLSPEDKQRVWALHNSASTQAEQAALQRALATGADVGSLERFTADVRRVAEGGTANLKAMGLDARAIHELSAMTPDQRVLRMTTLEGHQQFFTTSCNPTSFQIVRAEYDPMYALKGNLNPQSLLDEQGRLLRGANLRSDGQFYTPDGRPVSDVAFLRNDVVPPGPKRSLLDRLLGRNKPGYQVDRGGMGQGSYLNQMADQLNQMKHVTGVEYREHRLPQETVQGPNGPYQTTTREGRKQAVDQLDRMLIQGKPTEIGVTWRNPDGSPANMGHAIAVVDRRVAPDGQVQFLLHDPQLSLGGNVSTRTQWVNANDLVDGHLGGSYTHFGSIGQLDTLLLA